MKLFRRIEPGSTRTSRSAASSPRRSRFTRVPAVAERFEYERPASQPRTLAMVQQLVESQADGWTHAHGRTQPLSTTRSQQRRRPRVCRRRDDSPSCASAIPPPEIQEAMGSYLGPREQARTADRRDAPGTGVRHQRRRRSPPSRSPRKISRRSARKPSAQAQRAFQTLDARLQQAQRATADAGRRRPLPDDVAEQAAAAASGSRDALLERIRSAPRFEFVCDEDPRPRRLPSRAGPVGRRGLLPARLRGRAGAIARRSAARSSRR